MKTKLNPMVKIAVDELDRLHQIITHPNSSVELKSWAAKKIDYIHKDLFVSIIEIQGPLDFAKYEKSWDEVKKP